MVSRGELWTSTSSGTYNWSRCPRRTFRFPEFGEPRVSRRSPGPLVGLLRKGLQGQVGRDRGKGEEKQKDCERIERRGETNERCKVIRQR